MTINFIMYLLGLGAGLCFGFGIGIMKMAARVHDAHTSGYLQALEDWTPNT